MTGDQEGFAALLFYIAHPQHPRHLQHSVVDIITITFGITYRPHRITCTRCWTHTEPSNPTLFHQQKSTILQRDLGVHLPLFETAIPVENGDHQIQFSWKLSLHPNIQVNPNTSPTQTIDAVFLRTILAPRKKTTHTQTYWNLPLFQATLLFLASSFKRCQVDPRFKQFRYVWDVNHPSIGNLRQAGFIHNLPSLKLT